MWLAPKGSAKRFAFERAFLHFPSGSMSAPANILLIRFKSIGDVLFTLPAVYAVRENFPSSRISFLVSKENAPLIEGFPGVDEVIAVDRSVYQRNRLFGAFSGTVSLLLKLRRARFSLAVDFQGYGETGFLTWFTGASERWGMVYRPIRNWAYTRGVPRNWQAHPAEWNLETLRQCGLTIGAPRNEFALPEPALREAREFFSANGLNPERLTLFIQPFTSTAHKNWPLEKYLELARRWKERGAQILFGGGPAERAALEPARAAGFTVSAGVPLLVTGGLMKLSTLTIGGDTGMLHLAAALGGRVAMIMLYHGSTVNYPFRHPDWVLAAPQRKSLARVEVEEVFQFCETALGQMGRLPVRV